MLDLTPSIEPRSDQLNADDLIAGPRTYTIESVTAGSSEQPIDIWLVETDRAYRPSKSMRRVLVSAWGKDGAQYVGRRLTLYRDPEVTFGRDKVGGIKISHLSHIDKRMEIALTVTRGKRAPHVVQPLTERDWRAEADALTDRAALLALWHEAPPDARGYIEQRGRALAAREPEPDEDGAIDAEITWEAR